MFTPRMLALFTGAFALLLAGEIAPAAEKPNILFIISDDQRPATIAALGNPQIQTPNLDRLVREGTALPRAMAGYPLCLVSRREILTGRSAIPPKAGPRQGRISDD